MSNPKTAYTDEDAATVMRLRATGTSFAKIGEAIGRTGESARSKYAQLDGGKNLNQDIGRAAVNEMAKQLKMEIPADTRTPIQKMMGDPLPGRSAFDQRKAQVNA